MIELDNVSYTYPHTTEAALHGLSLSVTKGRCVMITGPSGSGKTTLCLAASGILHHEYGGKKEGRIIIEGRDVASYATLSQLSRTIGIVFDDAESQMIFTTVEEEILSALEYRGLEAAAIEERLATIMATTYLTDLRNRSPHHLSGGQKQRVALAATLALGNDLIILDEPTSELDEHATRRIVEILKALKHEGKTILLVEHKYRHFKSMIDTLVVLEGGAISALGSPDEVLSDARIEKIVVPDFSGIRDKASEKDLKKGVTSDPVISLNRLSYAYGDVPALDDISLDIHAAEFVAIVGENGSGKTTLVKHLNRLLSPTSGCAYIFGEDTRTRTISGLSRDVGLVFQNPDHMFFADTVKDEIEFGLKNLGMTDGEAIIESALNDVGLMHARHLYPRWLSRGERQRLAIACVIAMSPSIIVLDEPTTGLDGNEARLVMEILRNLQIKGHTIIVITHDKEMAQHCADRIITMEKGKIISDSSALGD